MKFPSLSRSLKALVAIASAAVLAACGSSSSTSTANAYLADVTPALGGFSAGAPVTVYDAATGKVVGTGTTAAVPLGTATINIGTFSGTIVVKVDGGANVNYLDERDTTKLYNFPAGSSLLAVIPNVGGGNKIGRAHV